MPAEKKPMRYGHPEGHTDVCFDDSGSYIVTSGSDGDVRIWESLEDDDPKSISVGEKVYSVALKNGKLVSAVSSNTVQIHTFPEGAPDGILTRFTTNANHVTFNDDGSRVAAGSSDFMVKVVEVNDSSQQKSFRGHEAPVLSVAFDPQDIFLASASCDGCVRVWNILDQTQVTSWPLLQKCNDVSSAKSICRLAWQPKTGKMLAVPVDKAVKLYERDSWDSVHSLTDSFITQPLNVVTWSPCGQYLAAGSIGGCIVVWNTETKECLERVKHEKGYTVCGLAWHPKGGQIAYTDSEGNLGLLEDVCDGTGKSSVPRVSIALTKDYDALFDGEDDELLSENLEEAQSPPRKAVLDDEDDDPMPTLSRPRHRSTILDDDRSLDVASPRPKGELDKEEDDDDDPGNSLQNDTAAVPQQPVYDGPVPTPQQKPFQSASTPVYLMHRFMVWNSVGIVRCYNDEQDNAIDIEFHDTAVHHAMHLTNTLNHTMADLSQEAVLLACVGTEELPSKLQCLHFSSWDTNKEWTVELPKEEDIEAVCLGQGWIAAATTALMVRIFTVGGVQKELFGLPGPVVAMAAHGEQLLIVFQRGTGFGGEQCLGTQLIELRKEKRQILSGEPLPLTRKSYLAWLGFSAEGTPCYVDSEGIVRMMNRAFGNTWTPVCNTREHCKGRSDHYWVVGIHENPQQLRCIPCKGSRFPPTLPRPAVAILPFKLPYCQTATEKGQMEEQFWRSMLFQNHLDYLAEGNYEFDESVKNRALKEQQELLMKMFALSCKLEREFRCIEISEFMMPNVINLAIKYASRSKRLMLAQRLSELALERAAELAEEEEEEDFRTKLNVGYSAPSTEWNLTRGRSHQAEDVEDNEVTEEAEDEMEAEEMSERGKQKFNTFSEGCNSPEKSTMNLKPAITGSQGRANPFKVSSNRSSPSVGGQARCVNILDNMTKLTKKPTTTNNQAMNKHKSPVLKPLVPKPKSRQTQVTLFRSAALKTNAKKVEEMESKVKPVASSPIAAENTENKKPKTGFQLWLEENRSRILADKPDLEEADIIKDGMNRFRILPPEERMTWTEKAKGGAVAMVTCHAMVVKKRKHPEKENKDVQESRREQLDDDTTSAKKQKPSDTATNSKLSMFAFKK
ncbi:WD repeat and HMG-box DNA-binding protein 1 [Latimeria chalumnae]|uniref:WD repeat and HMG-box DNA-binding protein 1 n=1 Tax=Latimeria chalumnae TaxID=7897 RepID=UPI00313C5B45